MELIVYLAAFVALGVAARLALVKHESYFETDEEVALRERSR